MFELKAASGLMRYRTRRGDADGAAAARSVVSGLRAAIAG
jgi:hypothetical protein